MNLENILNKLDGSIKIQIRVHKSAPYFDHEYNCIDNEYYEWDCVYDSLQSYYSTIVDVYHNYGKFEVLHIWFDYVKIINNPIMVIDVGEYYE